MEKLIDEALVGRDLDRVLGDVSEKNDRYLVSREGKPVAAVVSMRLYELWKQDRNRFFDDISAGALRANASPEEADALAAEAVQMTRVVDHP